MRLNILMKKNKIFGFGFLLTAFIFTMSFAEFGADPVELNYPKNWKKPNYDFEKNPLTKQGVALGRKLFYDPILSKDSTTSCSSCHLSFTAFTHVDHALSHGIGDSIGNRNSPALMNLAWGKSFMWDGSVHHLDVQALAPISDPRELGEDLNHVIEKLQITGSYPRLFDLAFGESQITGEHLLKALAQFQLTLISANSKYDKVSRGVEMFTEQEAKGYEIFKKNCSSCHREPLFTNGEFANNGLSIDSFLMDFGRMNITQNAADSLKFKVPTLRNIEFSFPYMHDGRFKKLREVINHYSTGIRKSETLAPVLQNGIELTSNEKVDLIAFLLTLTDKEFLFNRDFAFPR